MTRALTSGELALQRTERQWSELYLAIYKPPVVYSVRINQVFTAWNSVVQITYDGGSGTLANVLPGMTLYIGSSAGAYDKGMVRIRKAPSATVLYIGETSDVVFTDNDYLTVVDDFGLWARHLTVKGSTSYMDYDVAYTDQHLYPDPVPVLGPSAAVLWLTGASVNFSPDASASWVPGGTITGFSWSAPGASATANLTTATPTITYNAAGTYRVRCTVTASNGKTFTGHRLVFVFDNSHMPTTAFQLKSCSGYADDGGWKFDIEMYDQATLADVRDRALVVLFAKDHYDTTLQSIGPVTGYENIIAIGWIEGETIHWNSQQGMVDFTVRGPGWWMQHLPGFPAGMHNVNTTPASWIEMQSLTVDKGVWHMLHWRSTATAILDVALTGDTRLASAIEGTMGSLWDQLRAAATETILADPRCDRYGRLYIEIDAQYLPTASRSTIPVVQTLAKNDWQEEIQLDRRTVCDVAMMDISGVSYNGTTATALFAKAAGAIFRVNGRIETRDKLLFTNQADANSVAGALLSRANCEYPLISVKLAGINRMPDITPRQFITLSVAATDTPRGVTLSNVHILPRAVSFSHDPKTGQFTTEIDCELETFPGLAVTVIKPQTATKNVSNQPTIEIPSWPIVPFPPIQPMPVTPPMVIATPPDAPGTPCRAGTDTDANGPWNTWLAGTVSSTDAYSKVMPFPVYLRPGGAANPSRYTINGSWWKWDVTTKMYIPDDDDSWYEVYGLDAAGTRVATGIKDAVTNPFQRTGYFNPAAGVDIASIELSITCTETDQVSGITSAIGEHPWSAHDAPVFSWGAYAPGRYWMTETCHWDRAYYGYTGFYFTLTPVAGHSFRDMQISVHGVLTASAGPEQGFGGQRLSTLVQGDVATAEPIPGPWTYGANLTGTLNGVMNTGKDNIGASGVVWCGNNSIPVENFTLYVSCQVSVAAGRKIDISSVLLWNVCRGINYL